jgi:hypothetical protein
MPYSIFITTKEEAAKDSPQWIKPSQLSPSLRDVEPSLHWAIKAERFYQRSFGFATKRQAVTEA